MPAADRVRPIREAVEEFVTRQLRHASPATREWLEKRRHLTAAHAREVQELAARLARELPLSDRLTARLKRIVGYRDPDPQMKTIRGRQWELLQVWRVEPHWPSDERLRPRSVGTRENAAIYSPTRQSGAPRLRLIRTGELDAPPPPAPKWRLNPRRRTKRTP